MCLEANCHHSNETPQYSLFISVWHTINIIKMNHPTPIINEFEENI